MRAKIHDLTEDSTIPSGARGATIIFDLLYEQGNQEDYAPLMWVPGGSQGGYDGKGNFYLTDFSYSRLDNSNYHATDVFNTYRSFLPSSVSPAAILTYGIYNRDENNDVVNTFTKLHRQQTVDAYKAARTANQLVKESAYTAPRAIFNISLGGSHGLFLQLADHLQRNTDENNDGVHDFLIDDNSDGAHDFAEPDSFAKVAAGLTGVGSLGNSNTTSAVGFSKQPDALLIKGLIPNRVSVQNPNDPDGERVIVSNDFPASLGSIIREFKNQRDDSEGLHDENHHWNTIQIVTELTDLIAITSISKLTELVTHSSWTTPAGKISAAFSDLSEAQQNLVNAAGSLRILMQNGTGVSLLDLLAGATVHTRQGHFYAAAYLKYGTEELIFNTPCGALRYGCFVLPYYTSPGGQHGTSFAAPRLSAFIDAVWLIWPDLTNQKMHDLLAGCAKDLGTAGVDEVFGQGLLDFTCVANPAGGVRLPSSSATAQTQSAVQGLQGALYGSSTASTSLTTYDAFGRDFEHQVLHRTLNLRPAFDPFDNALVHNVGGLAEFAANSDIASVWLTAQRLGNFDLSLGATYEADSLFGMAGSGHFAIHDGRSIGVRFELDQPLSNFWNMRLSLAHYKGTASAAYPGAVSDLALEQSNSSITFERRFAKNSRAYLQVACSSGNSGTFNSFGTPIELFGASNCSHSIGTQIRW